MVDWWVARGGFRTPRAISSWSVRSRPAHRRHSPPAPGWLSRLAHAANEGFATAARAGLLGPRQRRDMMVGKPLPPAMPAAACRS
jgi:hypothetical protein